MTNWLRSLSTSRNNALKARKLLAAVFDTKSWRPTGVGILLCRSSGEFLGGLNTCRDFPIDLLNGIARIRNEILARRERIWVTSPGH
ncbi:hypothetical protein B0G77_4304 [Paraburkholderia sp. BL10I2N1]|nr:hypothetical protein B0G77_4304 [Paraburkholderia sp. BL10I2N1]